MITCNAGGTARRPLVGTVQQSQGVISQAASAISPAIADVYDNIRSKIFAMFNKIGEFHFKTQKLCILLSY
jgi:hypothetical protein